MEDSKPNQGSPKKMTVGMLKAEYDASELVYREKVKHNYLGANSTAEKLIILKRELERDFVEQHLDDSKISKDYDPRRDYHWHLKEKIEFYEEVFQLENSGANNIPGLTQEEVLAYTSALKRATALFEGQPFWGAGISLSDIVHVTDGLSKAGIWQSQNIDKAIAPIFQHIPQGKKTLQPVTEEKLKARRRQLISGPHKPSFEVQNILTKIIESLPKKRNF